MTSTEAFVGYDSMESVAAEVANQKAVGFAVSRAGNDGIWFTAESNEIPFFESSDDAYTYWKSLNR